MCLMQCNVSMTKGNKQINIHTCKFSEIWWKKKKSMPWPANHYHLFYLLFANIISCFPDHKSVFVIWANKPLAQVKTKYGTNKTHQSLGWFLPLSKVKLGFLIGMKSVGTMPVGCVIKLVSKKIILPKSKMDSDFF